MQRFKKMMSMAALAALAGLVLAMSPNNQDPPFTSDFGFEELSNLVPRGGNRYFSLRPGAFQRLEGEDDGQFVVVKITVLNEIKVIPFLVDGELVVAVARVVEEREWTDGRLAQISRNYYACNEDSGNVYYLGEDVDHSENGQLIGHEDSWRAGRDGAMPGLMMPKLFLLGARYQMEQAPDVSMDRGENVRMGFRHRTPAGLFRHCIMVEETTPLEPEEETIKIYAPGVGLIVDDDLELVAYRD